MIQMIPLPMDIKESLQFHRLHLAHLIHQPKLNATKTSFETDSGYWIL